MTAQRTRGPDLGSGLSRRLHFHRLRLDARPGLRGVTRVRLSLVGVLAQGGLRFGTNLLIGHLGGPGALGASSTAIASAQLASLAGPTTSGSAASKFVARSQGSGNFQEATLVARYITRITVFLALSLGLIASALWPAPQIMWWSEDRLVVFLLVLGYSGYSVARGVQFGSGHFWRGTKFDLVTSAMGILGVGVVLLMGAPPVLSLLPVALSMLAYSISGLVSEAEGTLSAELKSEIRMFLFLGVIGTLSSAGLLQGSVLIARQVDGIVGAGYYSSALTLATPISLIAGSISLALFPSLSHLHGSGDESALKKLTDITFRDMNALIPLAFAPLVICSSSLQHFVWGEAYASRDHAALLPMLLLACMANTLGVACTTTLTSRGPSGVRRSTIFGLAATTLCALAWLTLTPLIELEGVALGYLMAATLLWLLPVVSVWREGGHSWLGQVASILAAGGGMFGVATLARQHGLPIQIGLTIAFWAIWWAVARPPIFRYLGMSRENST